MATEEILSSTALVTQWIFINYCKTPDFFFRLVLLVNSPPPTMRFSHSSSMNTNLGKSPISLQCHQHQYHLVLTKL